MRDSGPYHEVTVKRTDDWGEASAVCTLCGYLGRFQSAYDAHEAHARKVGGGTPRPAAASICRGPNQ